jgi:hypothetical protein
MSSAPYVRRIQATIPAVTIAADADQTVGEAPFDGTVTGVSLTPEAAVTGNDTNYRTFTLVNKGASGAGTTVIATLALTNGVNLVAFDEESLHALSGGRRNNRCSAEDILAVCRESIPRPVSPTVAVWSRSSQHLPHVDGYIYRQSQT